MHITGQCHCGHITFEADANPDGVGICLARIASG